MIWALINGLLGMITCVLSCKFAVEGNVSMTVYLCTILILVHKNTMWFLKDGADNG